VRGDAWPMNLPRHPISGGHPTTGEHPHLAADTIASELRHIAAYPVETDAPAPE
jgi:hypothetical protein